MLLTVTKCAVVKASLDNAEIKNIDNYRIASGLFNVTYPSDSVIPTNSNFSQAVSDGWYYYSSNPLSLGNTR